MLSICSSPMVCRLVKVYFFTSMYSEFSRMTEKAFWERSWEKEKKAGKKVNI